MFHVERLHDLYGGRCQLCLFDPRDRYGLRLRHGHHIEWLSRGGEDEPENMVLLCPNHHAAVHRDDAPFDYAELAFRFSVGRAEPLLVNLHLPRAG
jgi:predicted restriction endonuclease